MVDIIASTRYGAINVPLSIFWEKAGTEQKNISTFAASNPEAWFNQLTTESRLWLGGRANTMAVFGEKVAILHQKDNWLYVTAVTQRTYLNSLGYPGWILASQVATVSTYLSEQISNTQAVITVPKATLYRDYNLSSRIRKLSYQVTLPILTETEQTFEVRLPDGSNGYLSRAESLKATELTYSGDQIVNKARQFLGVKYLWSGTSAYGFDCSGFSFRVYQSVGISLPRDASEQAKEGTPITKEELLPGDLVFFATENGQGQIHHVGIYTCEDKMIRSPNTGNCVREVSMNQGAYLTEYWGARRYVPNKLTN